MKIPHLLLLLFSKPVFKILSYRLNLCWFVLSIHDKNPLSSGQKDNVPGGLLHVLYSPGIYEGDLLYWCQWFIFLIRWLNNIWVPTVYHHTLDISSIKNSRSPEPPGKWAKESTVKPGVNCLWSFRSSGYLVPLLGTEWLGRAQEHQG